MSTMEFAQPVERWYCLHTKPRMEQQVHTILSNKNIFTYLPLIGVQRKRRGHSTRLVEPLFPSYLFARFDLEAVGISAVRYAYGMRDFVRFAGEPATVPAKVVESIQAKLENGETAQRLVQPRFQHGDPVRVIDGPFAGINAVFERPMSGNMRAQILVNLLGRQMPVELNEELLERASK